MTALPSADRPIVLVVDDDRSFQQFLATELRVAGFLVHQASDGLSALTLLEQMRPDAILLDLDLPRVNGLALVSELQARPETQSVPIIVVTGTDWTVPAAVSGVLRKPFTTARMLTLLSAAINRDWLRGEGV